LEWEQFLPISTKNLEDQLPPTIVERGIDLKKTIMNNRPEKIGG
jgi:hypothetical protein